LGSYFIGVERALRQKVIELLKGESSDDKLSRFGSVSKDCLESEHQRTDAKKEDEDPYLT
jgi:hypothetical protein